MSKTKKPNVNNQIQELLTAGFRPTPTDLAEGAGDRRLLFGSGRPCQIWIKRPTANADWIIEIPDVKIEAETGSALSAVEIAIQQLRDTAEMATKAADALVDARAILRLSR